MVDLIAKTACAGLLPINIGTLSLSEIEGETLTAIAPLQGQDAKLSDALKAAHGMAAPAPNRATGKQGARALWFGRAHLMLVGPAPDKSLAKHAALTDQSDAWAVVRLSGSGAADVLARLTPLDLRASQFKRGQTARTDLMHMQSSITCLGADDYMIMAFRSMAQTLVHDLKTAMEGVTARQ